MADERPVIYVRVPQETADRLDRLAERSQRSRSAVIRLLIDNATDEDLIPATLKEQEER